MAIIRPLILIHCLTTQQNYVKLVKLPTTPTRFSPHKPAVLLLLVVDGETQIEPHMRNNHISHLLKVYSRREGDDKLLRIMKTRLNCRRAIFGMLIVEVDK